MKKIIVSCGEYFSYCLKAILVLPIVELDLQIKPTYLVYFLDNRTTCYRVVTYKIARYWHVLKLDILSMTEVPPTVHIHHLNLTIFCQSPPFWIQHKKVKSSKIMY